MEYIFRKATLDDLPPIWEILQDAIKRRKEDGSEQWQDGYPNPEGIKKDIAKDAGFVLTDGNTVAGYCAILINDEPAYAEIEGQWLTDGDFVVFHRVAISQHYLGRGLSKKILNCIEDFARENKICSVKADTNFDNPAMLGILEKAGYVYCGEVFFRGSSRMAFEKVLSA
ncbi:GNAT family N-acetyltransferase [Pedobacter psychroterrae]|uniref:GNAT family N-acetyltransferase n=1 Tax=Pedobacter psychroterrae TaxID=2530453 RepID=A0A4R0NPP3_9SPHI|nr:GNAT family N-acetyltransferase [Pedobacter psychroterrae]TCD01195.1 GNAT family N-acetyltransferase [Pedobacter psychroterrae]